MFIIHETTSKLETRDCVDPIICRCRKHGQLARQEGGFVACFPLNVSMVHSPKPTIVTNSSHLISIGFVLGETIHFRSLEFIADHFCNLSLSPKGNDSGAIFMGMVHHGSPSLHIVLEESTDMDDTTSSGRENSGFAIS
jgi:hypothetical protein